MFDYDLQLLETADLTLEYFSVPWDTALMSVPVAQIRRVIIRDYERAHRTFSAFRNWKEENRIAFCTAKIPHHSTLESYLLQMQGYRFIELNYKPEINLTPASGTRTSEYDFQDAEPTDEPELTQVATSIFRHTRFHLDPLIPAGTGDRRYGIWMKNAFANPRQRVIKCVKGDSLQAFFVQENPKRDHAFWSLVGLAPDLAGRGVGRQIWAAALNWLAGKDIARVSTSISSLNTPVVNLYVALGFRFPEPEMTFHWHRERPRH